MWKGIVFPGGSISVNTKKILALPDLAIDLDGIRQTAQWTGSVYKTISVALLQDK
jgi:hypothetical protein